MKTYKNGIIIYDESLPKHLMKGRECIWWEKTIGHIIYVEYNGIKRQLKFIKYTKRKITYEVIESRKQFTSAINSFICHGNILKSVFPDNSIIDINWKYNIGEIVEGRLHNLKILNREVRCKEKLCKNKIYNMNEKWYRGECLDCGYNEIWFREDRPHTDIGCTCCSGLVLVKGKNDLATTNPEVLDFLTNPQEGYEHTKGEHIWLNTTCPLCGFQKKMYIINLALGKYTCSNCSDGISYPEKFLINVFNQLNIEYIHQFSRKYAAWCDKYKYDFWLKNKNAIVEVNGLQHYEDNSRSKKENVQKNDRIKYNLAMKNNINNYIVIDARKSTKDYIKNSIENSKLASMFDLSKIDWKICDLNAYKSYVIYACDRWNEGASVKQIAKELKLSTTCICTYLRRLKNTDLVNNYTSTESRIRSLKYNKGGRNATRIR